MLKEISCNIFTEKTIVFHSGLNVVLGDDQSTNSIGKSTLLMIIDFVYGGETYITNNSGSIKILEHHDIYSLFEFGNETYRFLRQTQNHNEVFICNSKNEKEKKLTLKEFTSFLKTKYELNIPDLSLRSIVSLYSRIWGKENDKVDKPLQAYNKETEIECVYTLIKLFNKYKTIAETTAKIKEAAERKKVIDGMFKKDFIKKINKTEFKQNKVRLEDFTNQLNNIKNNLLEFTKNTEALNSDDMLNLQLEKNKLLDLQRSLKSKIKRIEINLNKNSNIQSKHLDILSSFFEKPNLEKIEKIETFHNKIRTILREELNQSKKKLEFKEASVCEQINKIDQKITLLLKGVESPTFIVEKIYNLTVDSSKIETENKYFEKKETIVKDLSEYTTELESLLSSVLAEIELTVNNGLEKVSLDILGENKKSPKLTLKENNYSYDHFNNTGTGKYFVDLILFDLTILMATELPVLIHDSFLFKNIEDFTIDKIVKKYSENTKQIFISIDGVSKYNKSTIEIIKNRKVISLTNEKLLFIKDWRY